MERQGGFKHPQYIFEAEVTPLAVLRVFGVYTHAELDRHPWELLGRHLASKGVEYKRR